MQKKTLDTPELQEKTEKKITLEEKVDLILEACREIVKHLGEQAIAVDIEKRRGKFGLQVPPIGGKK